MRQAMEEGALGVGSSLIYVPGTFAETDELVALASTAARCGGIYATHMRSEGRGFLEAVDETIEISRRSGAPAEIYHLKAAGQANWPKMDEAIGASRRRAARGCASRRTCTPIRPAPPGLDAAMPPWVQAGGNAAWFARLRDPAVRKRVAAEMRAESDGLGKPDARGRRRGERADRRAAQTRAQANRSARRSPRSPRLRGTSPEEAAMDLVAEDETRVGTVYFLMSEDEVRRKVALPYMSFGSDGAARVRGGRVPEERRCTRAATATSRACSAATCATRSATTLEDAIRRMTAHPAAVLNLARPRAAEGRPVRRRRRVRSRRRSRTTRPTPSRTSTRPASRTCIVNGVLALENGEPTAARPGRFVRGRAWTGWPENGGCRATAADWDWPQVD